MSEKIDNNFENWGDYAAEAVQDAEAAAVRSQFGKLSIKPRFVQWVDRAPVEISAETYRGLPKDKRTFEIVVGIDIQEFNPGLEFTYERRVRIGSNEWWKVFKPSAEDVLNVPGGLNPDKISGTLAALSGRYVEMHDVLHPAAKGKEQSTYRTPKLARVFDGREACFAAWAEKFGGDGGAPGADTGAGVNLPPGWDNAGEWAQMADDFGNDLSGLVGKSGAALKVALKKIAEDYAITDVGWVQEQFDKIGETAF